MKKALIILVALGIAIINNGCLVTTSCVKKYNAKVDEKIIQLEVQTKENGEQGAILAINVLKAGDFTKGYWAAWKNEPGSMAAAHGLDALWMGAVYAGGKALYDEIKDDGSEATKEFNNDGALNISVEGSEGTSINIVYGDGNSSNNEDNPVGDSNQDSNE